MTAPALSAMLVTLVSFATRYVAFANQAQPAAAALWVVHAYGIDAFDTTPYLHVSSPEKRSGKSRLLEVLEVLVPKPWYAIGPSEAVLYRRIEQDQPSLLLDEVDAIFGKGRSAERYEPIRAALNAGWRRGAKVPRCLTNGKKVDLVEFSVFSPKVLTGIGQLPDTIADRCVPIRLRRRAPGEVVGRFRRREVEPAAAMLRDALTGWANDPTVIDTLRDSRPRVPDALHDRAADIWEPLIAVADLAGGDWPERARGVAVELSGHTEDDSTNVRLLTDVRHVFLEGDLAALPTTQLLARLVGIEDSPWAEWWGEDVDAGRTKGPAAKLARRLRPFEVRPAKIRTGISTAQGYRRSDFEDAWARYCSDLPPRSDSGDGTPEHRGSDTLFGSPATEANTASDQGGSDVPSLETERGKKTEHSPQGARERI